MGCTLTTKSQVTLPKAIREHLKVAPGDAVEFRIVVEARCGSFRSTSSSAVSTSQVPRRLRSSAS